MPPAPDLDTAAMQTNANLTPLWLDNTLQAKMIAFAAQLGPSFPDDIPNNQPVGGWIAVIAAFAPSIEPGVPIGTLTVFNSFGLFLQAVDYVYRLCRFATFYSGQGGGPAFITTAQAQAILDAYNDQFT